MNSKIFLLIFLIFTISPLYGQYNRFEDDVKPTEKKSQPEKSNAEDPGNFWKNLQYGGVFGMAFGTITFIEASPRVFYNLDEKNVLGIGGTFIYNNFKTQNIDITSTVYGGQLFYSRILSQTFFAHSEFEMINITPWSQINLPENARQREWVPGIYLGGGIRQSVGTNSFIYIYGLYNLLYDNDLSIQPRPWLIRAGFAF
jgi:hypothetical protein